ncbi:FAD-dependent monooxygenase [Williamsia soli]|uniref:FAD-dependent monooxygenase n=1 Tax=Williamsia soli TaxID=364929 RepID=UPI001F0130C6|nr:FAD-dependent monooxygenase [Williamsia soli]
MSLRDSLGHSVDSVPVAPSTDAGHGGDTEIFDVVIAGYGPTGVTCANLLGQAGLSVLVLERNPDVFNRARAVNLDVEAIRVASSLGLQDDVAKTIHQGVTLIFCDSAGGEMARIQSTHSARGVLQSNFVHQPSFESVMRKGAMRFPTVLLDTDFEVVDLDNGADFVTIMGSRGQEIRARYLLGCDGASSVIRKKMGATYDGMSYDRKCLTVHGAMKRFDGTTADPDCGPLFGRGPHFRFVCDPVRPYAEIKLTGNEYRFEIEVSEDEDPSIFEDEANVWKLLNGFGIGPDDFEILHFWTFTFHVRKAKQWRMGRTFLLGDAAHVTLPTIGQGVSSGMRDANNLAWKLIMVLRGSASADILDTYYEERAPHVEEYNNMAKRVQALIQVRNPLAIRFRNAALRAVSRAKIFQTFINGAAFRQVPIVNGVVARRHAKDKSAGQILPEFEVFGPDGVKAPIDTFLGSGFVFIGLEVDPATALPDAVRKGWEPANPRFLTLRVGRRSTDPGEISDPAGVLWDWFSENDARVVCIRPDRYLYAAGHPDDAVFAAPTTLTVTSAESVVTNAAI